MVNMVGWFLCGLLIGWAADRLNRRPPHGTLVVYGASSIMGAALGGVAALTFEAGPLDQLSLVSLIAAGLGALLAVSLARQLLRRLA